MGRSSLIFLILLITAANYSTPGQNILESAAQDLRTRIHVGDIVDVDLLGSFDFDWRGGLNPEGYLDKFDKIDKPVFALCMTETELARAIEKEYGVFLRSPQVRVRIIDRSNRPVAYVHGAVRQPHRFKLLRPASLIELLVYSGGITDRSRGEVTVFRSPGASCSDAAGQPEQQAATSSGIPKLISIKIADLLGGNKEANRLIFPGDVVQVSESLPVYVLGEVAAPRRLNLTPGLNLERAVAAAGGIVGSFRGQKIRVYRQSGDVRRMEYEWKTVVEKDIPLEPYDVIEVERRGAGPERIPSLPGPEELSRESLERLPLRVVD